MKIRLNKHANTNQDGIGMYRWVTTGWVLIFMLTCTLGVSLLGCIWSILNVVHVVSDTENTTQVLLKWQLLGIYMALITFIVWQYFGHTVLAHLYQRTLSVRKQIAQSVGVIWRVQPILFQYIEADNVELRSYIRYWWCWLMAANILKIATVLSLFKYHSIAHSLNEYMLWLIMSMFAVYSVMLVLSIRLICAIMQHIDQRIQCI